MHRQVLGTSTSAHRGEAFRNGTIRKQAVLAVAAAVVVSSAGVLVAASVGEEEPTPHPSFRIIYLCVAIPCSGGYGLMVMVKFSALVRSH